MSRTPERAVKDRIIEVLDAVGAVWCAPIGSALGKSDQCDFIACLAGRYIEIEAKATERDEPTELQKRKLLRVINAGGEALVVHKDNFEDLEWKVAGMMGVDRLAVVVLTNAHRVKEQERKANRGKKVIHLEEEDELQLQVQATPEATGRRRTRRTPK